MHPFGLALSRGWQARAVEREIHEGGFMSTHWLVSFAVLAGTAAPSP